jgi:hypothetical protein
VLTLSDLEHNCAGQDNEAVKVGEENERDVRK